jgi:tetratricopeptide (TPR) repeat protein
MRQTGRAATAAEQESGLADVLARSLAALRARRPRDALALIDGLPPAARADPRIAARRAYAHALLGEMALSLEAARVAVANGAADVLSLDLAGNSFTLCHQPEAAHAAFQRAAALAPRDPRVQLNLAATARFLGRMDAAEAAYDRVIAADPTAWAAYLGRSEVRRQTPSRNHIASLEAALRTGRPPPDGEIRLCYALGKECEDLERYDQAFAWFDRGARLRRAHMRYDVSQDVAALDLIGEVFDAAWCAPARDASGDAGPIFILGLPRTGSTLLERMLGRHSKVQPLGELQSFGTAMIATLRRLGAPPEGGKSGAIRAAAAAPPEAIGQAYLEAVAPLRDSRPGFIDKLPFNILYAGLIARALPSARIVHLTRDPADACLAIYKTLFDEAYPYSYDLAELGAYHNAYRRLAAHWRAALGERFVEVAYEDLVAAPAGAVERLLTRLGLAMEPACLRPEDASGPIMTASAAQARAPVNDRSVGRWRRYERQLGPLLEILETEANLTAEAT